MIAFLLTAIATTAMSQHIVVEPATTGKHIVVNLAEQKLFAYQDNRLIFTFHCSTARPGRVTPTGSWKVTEKLRYNNALDSLGGGPIPFSLRLNTSYNGKRKRVAIHAYKSVPSYPASNGCIRLSYQNAEKLFSWAVVGTVVIIQKDYDCWL